MAEKPDITVPEGGWDAVMGTATTTLDLSKVPVSPVLFVNAQYRCQPGKAPFVAKLLEATQGTYYRKQPGCLMFVHGICRENSDVVLSSAAFASKEAFESLPKNAGDREKLDAAREQAYQALQGGTRDSGMDYLMTETTFGNLLVGDPAVCKDNVEYPTFEQVFPNGVPDSDQIPSNPLFFSQGIMNVQQGKAEECARGLEASMCTYYRSFPGVPWYSIGTCKDKPNTLLLVGCFDDEQYYGTLPLNPKDLEKLNAARGPYFQLLDGDVSEAVSSFKTSQCFGNPF